MTTASWLTSPPPSISPAPAQSDSWAGCSAKWAVWTQQAVALFGRLRAATTTGSIPADLLALGVQLTDANAALFDAANGFRGCIPGIHEALRRQRLLTHTTCLDPDERLSPGQVEQIDRIWSAYPHLRDDAFVDESGSLAGGLVRSVRTICFGPVLLRRRLLPGRRLPLGLPAFGSVEGSTPGRGSSGTASRERRRFFLVFLPAAR